MASDASDSDLKCVCAIGASAGGLAPVEEFFDSMPAETGTAFIVVQHLSPDHESMMVSLLSSHTDMPVEQAVNGAPLEPDHVYLISPGTVLSVLNEKFRVEDRDPDSRDIPRPIDHFFKSMSYEYKDKSIAIVLSGTGSDGTSGIETVRQAGGITLVQDSSAAFVGMPTAAHQSGYVDAVLDPSGLAEVVVRFALDGQRPGGNESYQTLGDDEQRILSYLTMTNDIDFREYKPATISRRLQRRMMMTNHGTMSSYADVVRDDHDERVELIDDLFIDVTQFFRDTEAFLLLENNIIPDLVKQAADENRAFRMWVPGCATGEEAYSLTMLAMEAAAELPSPPAIQTFATDVHTAALDKAGSGQYPAERMEGVSPQRRQRFFEQIGNAYVVRSEVRSALTFARHNLLTDAPFTRVDLVSCRNLLIYFRTAAQERAISSMGFALRHEGVLVLGPSETLGFAAADYAPINATWRMWRKQSDQIERSYRRNPPMKTDISVNHRSGAGTADLSVLRAYDTILAEQYSSGLLVNQRREIVYVMGGASGWLSYNIGRPTSDVMSLIGDAGLRLIVGATLRELEGGETDATPRSLGANFAGDDGEPLALLGKRVQLGPNRYHFLVYTAPGVPSAPIPHAPLSLDAIEGSEQEHVQALEVELRHTRESLQASLEEQETSNEELNAANEELIASNEELQSTNEELSSVNEELRTLNDEHQRRLDQMLELSADLEQLMSSTEIAVVFLAEDGSVRRFNEPARDYFRIRDNDIARPFTDIVTTLTYPELHDDIATAFATGSTASKTIRNSAMPDQRLLSQVSRYELPRHRSGVLIAIVNITEIEVADQERMLAASLHDMPAWFAIWNQDNEWTYSNRPLGTDTERPEDLIGRHYREIYERELAGKLAAENQEILRTGMPTHDIRTIGDTEVIASKYLSMVDGEPHVTGMAIPVDDVRGLPEMDRALVISQSLKQNQTVAILSPFGEVLWADGPLKDALPASWSHEGLTKAGLVAEDHVSILDRVGLSADPADTVDRVSALGRTERYAFNYVPMGEQSGASRYPTGSIIVHITSVEHLSKDLDQQRHRVAELESDLRDLQSATTADVAMLAERNEDLDNFAHVAAHDLKAPIRSVRSFAEMALEDIPDDNAAHSKINQVVESAKRMSRLVESLLDFAAIGRERFEPDVIDLNKLVDDVQIDLRSEIDDRSAAFEIDLEAERLTGNGDALRQVLANLVQNSLKFAGDSAPQIQIHAEHDRQGVRIDVTDNGIGFPEQEADRLFEPFQRLHAVEEPGSGVGLAICRRIVQRHDGKIWASNHPNGGTTFSFWIPSDGDSETAE